jgi:protoporphyrinogen oxidase
MSKSWQPYEVVTAMQWCEQHMGKEGFDELWLPLLRGKFGDEWASRVNMAWFWSRLACRTPLLGTYQGGFQNFFDDVEKWLERNGVRVLKEQKNITVKAMNGGWEVATPHQTHTFDKLVIAAGAGAFAALCGKEAPHYAEGIVARPSVGAHVVIFSLKKNVGKYYWYNLRKTPERPFLALIEHTNFVPKEEFGGEHIVYLANYLDTKSAEWYEPDAITIEHAIRTLQFVAPHIARGDINNARVWREAYAQPLVGISASKHIPPIRVPEVKNLYHGSMAHIYPWDRGTNFALELGKKIALEILK